MIRAALAWGLALVALGGNGAAAQTAPDATEPIRFRRILVPEGYQPDSQARLLPLRAADFERLANTANGNAHPPAGRIEQADCECRLIDGAFLQGAVTLRVVVEGEPAVVWLDPSSLAIRSAAWSDPAVPLRWGQTAEGRLGLLASTSGELRLEWSSVGVKRPNGAVAFNLELPPAPVLRLAVASPAPWRVDVRGASGSALSAVAGVWPLRESRCAVEFTPPGDRVESSQISIRESNLYEHTSGGLSLAAEWTLDFAGEPLARIPVEVDEPLRLLGAKAGEQELTLFPKSTDAGRQLVELAAPTALTGSNRLLTLAAVAVRPLRESEPLPRLRLPGAFWQQGASVVRVTGPRECFAAEPVASRTVRVTPDPQNSRAASWEFQHFAPDWSVGLHLASTATIDVRMGTSLACGLDRHRALHRAEFLDLPPDCLRLEAHVAESWRVVRVEREGAPSESWNWEVKADSQGSLLQVDVPPGSGGSRQALRVELERPGGLLATRDVRPLQWRDARVAAEALALRAGEGVRLTQRSVARIAWRQAADVVIDAALPIERAPGTWIADAQSVPSDWELEVEAAAPRAPGSRWQINARDDGKTIRWRYEIELEPVSVARPTLDVQFEPPGGEPLQWTLAETPDQPLPARRLEGAELPAVGAEVWRVELPPEPTAALRLAAERAGAVSQSAAPVRFPRVLGARTQEGELRLDPSLSRATLTDLRGLTAVSTGRYLHAANTIQAPQATLTLGAGSSPTAVVREQRGIVRVNPEGGCETQYTWTTDGRFAREFRVAVDRADAVRSLSVDGRMLPAAALERALPLEPRAEQHVSLTLADGGWFSTPLKRLTPRSVNFEALVAHRTWRIELPSEWMIVSPRLPQASSPSGVESTYVWSAERPPSVWIVRRDAWIASGLLAALAGGALALLRRGPAIGALVVTLSLAAALVSPRVLAFVPLAFAAGWLVMAAAQGVRRVSRPAKEVPQPAAAPWILLALLVVGGSSAGAQDPQTSTPAAATTYEVLIPTDERGQPLADGWLAPEPLIDALLSASGIEAALPRQVWIERADYRGELLWARAETPELRLTARLRVHAFSDDAWLSLPWSAALASAVAVRVDGAAAATDGAADTLRIRLPGRGTFDVEVPLTPSTQAAGDGGSAELPIPSVPASRLEMRVSPDFEMTVPSARGAIERDAANSRLLADLGAATRLTLRWTSQPHVDARPDVEAEQWLQLDVRPGAVLLRTRLAYRVLSGSLTELRFTADPRLRWLPLTQDGVATASLAPSPLDPTAATVPLVQPVSGQWNFQATLLLTGHSGVGQLALPRLEPRDVVVRRRWIAVSVDPALSAEIDAPAERRAAADFEARWGERLPAGAQVFEAPSDGWPTCVVRTRPQQPEPRVQQSLRYFLDLPTCRWELSVRWPPGESRPPECRIAAPPDVDIDRLEVRSEGSARSIDFARDASGDLLAAPGGDPGGGSELLISGHWKPTAGSLELPRIALAGAVPLESTVDVLRSPRVRFTLADVGNEPPLADAFAWQGDWRRAATFRSADEAPQTLELQPVRPITRLTQAVYVSDAAAATFDVVARIDQADDAHDELEWELDAGWNGPLVCEPQGEAVLLDQPDGRQVLRARFARPLVSGESIRVRGLRAASNTQLAAPQLRPLLAEQCEPFVVLPGAEAAQDWVLEGWSPAEAPTGFPAAPGSIAFRAADAASAPRRRSAIATALPRVVRADYRLRLAHTAPWLGQMTWIVDPRGADRLLFEVERGVRVEQAVCEGKPAIVSPTKDGRCAIELASRDLPQRIDVLISGSADNPPRIAAPKPIVDAARPTTWRVWTAGLRTAPPSSSDAEATSAAAADLDAWRDLLELLSAAALRAERSAAVERAAWFSAWGRRLADARQAAAHVADAPPGEGLEDRRARLTAADRALSERFPEFASLQPASAAVVDWIDDGSPPDHVFHAAGDSAALPRLPSAPRPWTRALLALGITFGGLLCAGWLSRSPRPPDAPAAATST